MGIDVTTNIFTNSKIFLTLLLNLLIHSLSQKPLQKEKNDVKPIQIQPTSNRENDPRNEVKELQVEIKKIGSIFETTLNVIYDVLEIN